MLSVPHHPGEYLSSDRAELAIGRENLGRQNGGNNLKCVYGAEADLIKRLCACVYQVYLSASFVSDPFVKVQLVAGLKLVKTKKTSCMRGTIDPYFNESFSFRVSHEDLSEVSLVFTGKKTHTHISVLIISRLLQDT